MTELHVIPGRWVKIRLDGLKIDNLRGATEPTILALRHMMAEVDAFSLLYRPIQIRILSIDGLDLTLEHGPDGAKNWRFGPERPAAPKASSRSSFPFVMQATLRNSEIAVRSSGGSLLRTQLDEAALKTTGQDAPVELTGRGLYNETPVSLHGDLGSFAVLHDAKQPFPVVLRMASGDTTLGFEGTMMDPLDVDGARGHLSLIAPTAKAVLSAAGLPDQPGLSLRLAGSMERDGDHWRLNDATGAIGGSGIKAASLRLKEGGRGQPDEVAIEIAFDELNLDRLLASQAGGQGAGKDAQAEIPLKVDASPGALVDAKISAAALVYNGVRGTDARLEAALTPGALTVRALALTYLGAHATASGRIDGTETGGRVAAEMSLAGADLAQLARTLSVSPLPISGRIDLEGTASATGDTVNAAVRGATVSAVGSMTGGSIARSVLELASTDLRRVFRAPAGSAPVSCLLAVLQMRAGSGTVQPLRVRATEGTITGNARFELAKRWFELSVAGESAASGALALNIPILISGSFSNPTIRPAAWTPEGRAMLASTTNVTLLPPRLRELALKNPCMLAQ